MTWIFCYGSNRPRQLFNRIGTTSYEDVLSRILPVKLHGYKRGFCNDSTKCRTSPATIFKTDDANDVVEGIAMHMTAAELALHDPYEGYPNRYNRYDITMEAFVRPEDGSDGPFVST